MRFLFVDRILELEPGQRALGVKHVTAHDEFLEEDGALSSCIIGETLGQLGAWTVMAANGFTLRPVAGVVAEVRMFGRAYAGDTILLDTRIDSLTEEAVHYHSVATVRGQKVLTLTDSLGPFLPMEQFNDPAEVKAQFALIHRPGTFAEPPAGEPDRTRHAPGRHVAFDRVVAFEKGKELTAVKHVSIQAPFFADHFPRKHVYPLSVLLEGQMQLARRLVGETLRPVCIRNIKMSDFVQPGSSVVAKLQVADGTKVRMRSEVDGKRVCVAEAEFSPEPDHHRDTEAQR